MTADDIIAIAKSTEPGKKAGTTKVIPPIALIYKPTGEVVHVKSVSKNKDSMNRVLVEEFLDTDKWWRDGEEFELPA